jgi:hypothetical protein
MYNFIQLYTNIFQGPIHPRTGAVAQVRQSTRMSVARPAWANDWREDTARAMAMKTTIVRRIESNARKHVIELHRRNDAFAAC